MPTEPAPFDLSAPERPPPAGEAPQNRLVQILQTAAHPATCVFHAAFKIASRHLLEALQRGVSAGGAADLHLRPLHPQRLCVET